MLTNVVSCDTSFTLSNTQVESFGLDYEKITSCDDLDNFYMLIQNIRSVRENFDKFLANLENFKTLPQLLKYEFMTMS
jgi:hypothetical protein